MFAASILVYSVNWSKYFAMKLFGLFPCCCLLKISSNFWQNDLPIVLIFCVLDSFKLITAIWNCLFASKYIHFCGVHVYMSIFWMIELVRCCNVFIKQYFFHILQVWAERVLRHKNTLYRNLFFKIFNLGTFCIVYVLVI